MTSIALFDSHFCYDISNFIAICMQALTVTINLELPHINAISKIDLLKDYGQLPFRLADLLEA